MEILDFSRMFRDIFERVLWGVEVEEEKGDKERRRDRKRKFIKEYIYVHTYIMHIIYYGKDGSEYHVAT